MDDKSSEGSRCKYEWSVILMNKTILSKQIILTVSLIAKGISFLGFLIGVYYLFLYNFPSDKSTAWGYLLPIVIGFSIQAVFFAIGFVVDKVFKVDIKSEKLWIWSNRISKITFTAFLIILFFTGVFFIVDVFK